MEAREGSVAFFSHIPFEDGRLSLAEVDDDQAIDDVRKFAVEIESGQSKYRRLFRSGEKAGGGPCGYSLGPGA
jgi:hypothetical protein